MKKELGHHPGAEELEEYSRGTLPEPKVPKLEQHILICHGCQDRLAQTDAYVKAMKSAAREVRTAQEKEKARPKVRKGGCAP